MALLGQCAHSCKKRHVLLMCQHFSGHKVKCCGTPLTACWSRGRNGLHAYYLCHGKPNGIKCSQYGKSIRKDKLEGEFEALLTEMKPSKCQSALKTVQSSASKTVHLF